MASGCTLPGIGLPVRPGIPSLPAFPVSIGPIRATTDGSTTIGTLGVRYELPAQVERFRPYLAVGLGINNTDQQFRLERTLFTPAFDESASHAGYAFSAGGGASVRLAGQFWADVDAKYFRLSRDRNIMRLGGGVSVRLIPVVDNGPQYCSASSSRGDPWRRSASSSGAISFVMRHACVSGNRLIQTFSA